MITGFLADVGEVDPVARPNDEHTPLLPGVAHCRALALPFAKGAEPAEDDAGAERAAQAALETGGRVGVQLGIDVERRFHVLGVTEVDRMLRLAVADDDQFGAAAADVWKCVTQLRDLLAAEDSTKVADEGEDHRLVTPEVSQPNGLAGRIQHADVLEMFRHIHWFSSIDSTADAAIRPCGLPPLRYASVRSRPCAGHPPPSRERP